MALPSNPGVSPLHLSERPPLQSSPMLIFSTHSSTFGVVIHPRLTFWIIDSHRWSEKIVDIKIPQFQSNDSGFLALPLPEQFLHSNLMAALSHPALNHWNNRVWNPIILRPQNYMPPPYLYSSPAGWHAAPSRTRTLRRSSRITMGITQWDPPTNQFSKYLLHLMFASVPKCTAFTLHMCILQSNGKIHKIDVAPFWKSPKKKHKLRLP